MSLRGAFTIISLLLLCLRLCATDSVVQLNVNRPFNDVNEKFVSFILKPEDLYRALDGPNRKVVTRMAALLGDAYIKFIGDFYFASTEFKLRNPTKIIWKGFNRWTRAVNWTMIIPVPYSPSSWDPMIALKILNTSHNVGITDCIWQLGTDFGSSHAQDYVNELNTLNLMVDSFKSFVQNWKVIGADVSAGSSAEETRRYIEMSKDMNAAFGWTPYSDGHAANSLLPHGLYNENDAALRMLLHKKVPVWLSLSKKAESKKSSSSNEVGEAFQWAKTLGDAANQGFDAVFKKLSLRDLEKPTFSFYVTALFKKTMGSRVFAAKPLQLFNSKNKLYTHCANDVSGGMAFMVVNSDAEKMHISVRSLSTLKGTEVWQYSLTYEDGDVLLNNEQINLNSSLAPEIFVKSTDKPVQLSAPAMSVSFWVLPTVNLEHCQFTEVEAGEFEEDAQSAEHKTTKRYSSSADRLLRSLIQESSLSQTMPLRNLLRQRRDTQRAKRFVLQEKAADAPILGLGAVPDLSKLFEPLALDGKILKKRENDLKEDSNSPLDWLKNLMGSGIDLDLPFLQRNRRSTDDLSDFLSKNGLRQTMTKKITEIKKAERKTKPLFDLQEFDEEQFFKNMGTQAEPEYVRVPDGDVHLKHIANIDGDDLEEEEKTSREIKQQLESSKEIVSEVKPLKLLPTEFYESLPKNMLKPRPTTRLSIGGALNSLLFPEPFSKKPNNSNKRREFKSSLEDDKSSREIEKRESDNSRPKAKDFLRAQKKLSKSILNDYEDFKESKENKKSSKFAEDVAEQQDDTAYETTKKKQKSSKRKNKNYSEESFFDADEKPKDEEAENAEEETPKSTQKFKGKKELDEIPWWDLSSYGKKRETRALKYEIPDEIWKNNIITKDDVITPLGEVRLPDEQAVYQYDVADLPKTPPQPEQTAEVKAKNSFVATVKHNVSKFVDIVTRHVNEWYSTLIRHRKQQQEENDDYKTTSTEVPTAIPNKIR